MAMLPGVCCWFCIHFEQSSCPVQTAAPWSKWEDWCSQYQPNPTIPEARTLRQAWRSVDTLPAEQPGDQETDESCGPRARDKLIVYLLPPEGPVKVGDILEVIIKEEDPATKILTFSLPYYEAVRLTAVNPLIFPSRLEAARHVLERQIREPDQQTAKTETLLGQIRKTIEVINEEEAKQGGGKQAGRERL